MTHTKCRCCYFCLAKFHLKVVGAVSCKLRHNVLVLVVFDDPWSNRPLVPGRGMMKSSADIAGICPVTTLYRNSRMMPLLSAFLERFHMKFRQHGCDTFWLWRRLVPLDKSRSSLLYAFELVSVLLEVRIPNNSTVLHQGLDK